MASDGKPLALLVLIHTKSRENRDRVIALNNSNLSFFRNPSTQHSTRAIFTPTTRPKAQLGMVPSGEASTLLGLLEIWSSSAAFSAVKQTSVFKSFHSRVAEERLYDPARDMEISEWIPAAGFVARKGEKESPKAAIVVLAKFVLKDNDLNANRDGLVGVLGKFCDWVEQNESGTLTYHVLTSAKNPGEVLMFERYKDLAALGVHGKTAEFKTMFRGTGRFIQGKKTVLSEWEELDGSFVSNTPGGAGLGGQPKL
ncbi:hypothetical protein G647_05041 [Cladophialophora carrionii CBS 160.54]|uniref:ABM domain-containing protein n=1 Tax=Cladophialophora carrionii CBS 160.54 TaxID=1279043 RepID=V9DAA8_9EURO|nr:uncharacterized protein G647_05041 [Cladophialophora carrionii CBS 160.54]ETI23243.1 hypothetical protein G647_05041 [Cladophialophora carrionii CBS 160.54]